MSSISEIGGPSSLTHSLDRAIGTQDNGFADKKVGKENGQARNETSATPAAGDTSKATGSESKGVSQKNGPGKSAAHNATAPVARQNVKADIPPEAQAQSIVQAQISFLIAPPFDGEPSARMLADATSQKLRFQLLMEVIGKRPKNVLFKPAAAEQLAAVSVESPWDKMPV